MRLEVVVTGGSVEEVRRLRQQIVKGAREDMTQAVREKALPLALRAAPGRTQRFVRAGATARSGYLELARVRGVFPGRKGQEAPRVNMFGGQRRDVIEPRRKWSRKGRGHRAAVMTPYGPRARVTTPRRYKPNPWMDRVVLAARPRVLARTEELLRARFNRAGVRTGR